MKQPITANAMVTIANVEAIIANVVQKVPITANVMVTIVNVVTFQQIPV